MDALVHSVKAVLEGSVDGRDSMELGIVRTHNGTVVADKLFTAVTEVAKWLLMEQAELLAVELASGCRKISCAATDIGRHR
jgi:hypothetical protein